jgi:uncharacterized damage-inducible protein DinB
MIKAFEYLLKANGAYRKEKFEKLEELSKEILHKKSSEKGWCIEELLRHMIRTEEWWMHRIILQDGEPFHPIGIANDTTSTKWYDLDEIWKAWIEAEEVIHQYLNSNPQLDLPVSHPNPDWNEKFSGGGVIYHLLQHELETWGMIAERLRNWGSPYWEF